MTEKLWSVPILSWAFYDLFLMRLPAILLSEKKMPACYLTAQLRLNIMNSKNSSKKNLWVN